MVSKDFYKSKTFWFNALALLVAIVAYFGFGDFEPAPEVAEVAAGVAAVINIVLRFATNQPIKL